MSAVKKSRFLCHRGKVFESRMRWIFIECEAFGFAYEYLVWIRDCKRMTVVVERVKACGDSAEV